MSENQVKDFYTFVSIILNNIGFLALYFLFCSTHLDIGKFSLENKLNYISFFTFFTYVCGSFLLVGVYLNFIYNLKKKISDNLLKKLKHTSYILIITYYIGSFVKAIICSLSIIFHQGEIQFTMPPLWGKLALGIFTPLWFLCPLLFITRFNRNQLKNILILYVLNSLICFTLYNLQTFIVFLLGGSVFLITEKYGILLTQKMISLPEKLRMLFTIPIGLIGLVFIIPYFLIF